MNAPQGAPPQGGGGRLSALAHLGKALRYSSQGLAAGMRLSLSFRQEAGTLVIGAVLLAVFGKTSGEWLLCLGAWALVMAAELLNTALEEALNLITTGFSPQVRDAKDMASAAVFLLLLLNAGVWLFVFWPDISRLWT